MGRGTTRW